MFAEAVLHGAFDDVEYDLFHSVAAAGSSPSGSESTDPR
jgi:hypothetical protein